MRKRSTSLTMREIKINFTLYTEQDGYYQNKNNKTQK